MSARTGLWPRVRGVLRWWPEYLVLVLLCMAVQIPVGVVALDREHENPFDEQSASVVWDFSALNAGPPPEDGWPFEAYSTTSELDSPTQIMIKRTWWMWRIRAVHEGPDPHRQMHQTRWGWPLTALWSGGAYSSRPEFPAGSTGASHFADHIVARVAWFGLLHNSMLFGAFLLTLIFSTSVVVQRMRFKEAPKPARRGWLADSFEARHRRGVLGAIGIGLMASVVSSAVAANSLNHVIHFVAAPGFNAPGWLTPLDVRLPSTRWGWPPDPQWNLPDRPESDFVFAIPDGPGFQHFSSVTRASREYLCRAKFYGWPLTSLADGSWTIEPATDRPQLGELRPRSAVERVDLPLRVHWPGFILNPLLAVIVLWPLVFGVPRLWVWWVVRRRWLSGHCVTCNYDCVGLERCPECGRVVGAIGMSPTREGAGI